MCGLLFAISLSWRSLKVAEEEETTDLPEPIHVEIHQVDPGQQLQDTQQQLQRAHQTLEVHHLQGAQQLQETHQLQETQQLQEVAQLQEAQQLAAADQQASVTLEQQEFAQTSMNQSVQHTVIQDALVNDAQLQSTLHPQQVTPTVLLFQIRG